MTELERPPTLLPGAERLRLSRRSALRFGSSWLCGLVLPAALAATTRAARGANIRVGFINPWGPPEFWQLVSATMQAAAVELGIEVEERHTGRSFDRAIAFARDFLNQRPPPDYLIATNDVGVGGELIKLADAAGVPLILLNTSSKVSNGQSTVSRARNTGTGSAASCPITRAEAMESPRRSSSKRRGSRSIAP